VHSAAQLMLGLVNFSDEIRNEIEDFIKNYKKLTKFCCTISKLSAIFMDKFQSIKAQTLIADLRLFL